MYNSILIGGLVKLWNIFSSSYDHSFLKKIVDKIKNFSSYLFQYSIIRSIFVSKDSLIYKSVFYRGFSKIVLFVDKILHRIHKFFMSKTNDSLIYKNINILFLLFMFRYRPLLIKKLLYFCAKLNDLIFVLCIGH